MSCLSFRQRQYLVLVAIAIIPLALVTSLTLVAGRNFVIERTTQQLETLADLKTTRTQQWLNEGREVAGLLVNLADLGTDLPSQLSRGNKQIQAAIEVLNNNHSEVESISLLHPEDGQVLISTDPIQVGRVRQTEDYFQAGQQALFISPVHYSISREAPVIVISVPLRSKNGALLAVATVEMNTADLQAVISNRTGLGQTGRAYLVEAFGFYVTRPNSTVSGSLRATARSEGVTRALAGQNGNAVYPNPLGVQVVGVYRWLPEAQLGLLVEIEEAEMTAEIVRLTAVAVLPTFVLLGLAVLATRTLTHWLVTPLERIVEAARRLQAGELGHRAPHGGPDEIGQLATAFNEMADSLQRSHAGLEGLVAHRTAELLTANEQLQQEITERKHAEEALHKSEARLAGILGMAFEAIISVDDTQQIIIFNTGAERIFGYARDEIIGRSLDLLIPRRFQRIHHSHMADFARSTGQARQMGERQEVAGRRRNGEEFPAEASISKIVMDGKPIFTAMLHDITERKQAEQQLQYQASLFRQVSEAIIATDLDLSIISWNEAATRIYGWTEAEAIGLQIDVLLKTKWSAEAQTQAQKILTETRLWQGELVQQHKEGRPLNIWASVSFVLDNDMNIVGGVTVNRDITERKQADKERERLLIAEREQRLQAETLGEVTLAITSQLDLDAVLLEILRQVQRLVPYKTANIALLEDDILRVGRWQGYEAFGSGDFVSNLVQPLSDFLIDAEAVHTRKPVVISDTQQDPRWVSLETAWIRSHLAVPIYLRDRVLGLLRLDSDTPGKFSIEDAEHLQPLVNAAAIALENARLFEQAQQEITERKRAEEQISVALKEKELLLKEIHHRVKNNLQIVHSLLDMQSYHITDEQAIEALNQSKNRIQSMAFIHDQLYKSTDFTHVDFATYLEDLTTLLLDAYDVNPEIIDLRINAQECVLGIDNAIPCALLIHELVSNSLQHAFPNGSTGEIRIDLHQNNGEYTLTVADNGVGIPPGVDFRDTESLGLELVVTLAEQLDGVIELDRSAGTAFTIQFSVSP